MKNTVIAEYYGIPFELTLTEQSESYYKGFLKWDEESRKRYFEVEKANEDDEEWYLDENGYRLEDEKLFLKSPWRIVENGETKKAVRRFSDGNGEVWFDMQPWFRIGDEYNSKPQNHD